MVGAGKEGLSFEENTCVIKGREEQHNLMIMEWCYRSRSSSSSGQQRSAPEASRKRWETLNSEDCGKRQRANPDPDGEEDLGEESELSPQSSETSEDETGYGEAWAMASSGWTSCYWCQYSQYNPYIIDWIGQPLCDNCFDWHMCWFGGPYEPTGAQRAARLKAHWFPQLQAEEVSTNVAEFLLEWHVP